MGSQWTNKYAILRDLSFAQGRKVPAAIVGSIGVGQKPPEFRPKEETEEEFFQNCVGDGDVYTKPDLTLIKEMINMVRESDPVDDDDTEKVVEITKLNPLCHEFVPRSTVDNTESNRTTNKCDNVQDETKDSETIKNHIGIQRQVKPNKKRINVALLSLLEKEQSLAQTGSTDENIPNLVNETFEGKLEASTHSEVKLLKPNDFIVDTSRAESVEKVKEWLQNPVEPPPEKAKPIDISPKDMFKKRTPVSLDNTCMFKRKSDTSSIKSSDSDTMPRVQVPRQVDNVFVPSTHANEYYKTYVERRQVQEKVEEDIWKRAERLMKEIDAKRLKEKEKSLTEASDFTEELNVGLEKDDANPDGPRSSLPLNIPGVKLPCVRLSVLLPQHRHELPGPCKVCLALAKYQRLHGGLAPEGLGQSPGAPELGTLKTLLAKLLPSEN